jgi:hypothetical protein
VDYKPVMTRILLLDFKWKKARNGHLDFIFELARISLMDYIKPIGSFIRQAFHLVQHHLPGGYL